MSNRGSVPKFSSFKPRNATPEKISDSKHGDEGRERPSRERNDRRQHHKHRHSHSRDKETSHHVDRPVSEPLTAVEKQPDLFFVVDRKGDWQNIVYNSVYKAAVPPFHRAGYGRVLGADRDLKIDRAYNEPNGLVLSARGGFLGKREKYAFSRNEKKPERFLKIRQASEMEDVFAKNVDFMTIQSSRKRKRSGSDHDSSSDEGNGHYRSIEGKMKMPTEPTDDAFEYATESDSSGSDSGRIVHFDEAMKQKTIELSRKVDEQPDEIQGWLDLIEHQERLLGLGDSGPRKITNAERRSTADIKIHMYEKAIEKAGSSPANRERLVLGLMKEGSKIWDFKTRWQKWEKVLQESLHSLVLWRHYLDFRQSTFQAFQYEEVRDIYLKRIKLLIDAVNTKSVIEAEKIALYEQLIYTVLRATLFMREAGYPEIGVAIWQALLEFNFQAPKPDSPTTSRLEQFKDFWESEIPRIGEDGANGWRAFVPDRDTNLDDARHDGGIPPLVETTDVLKAWAAAEIFRAEKSTRPARTIDDVAENDPYRVILWSDIEDFLIDLTSEHKELRWLLLDAFLIFYRLPPIPTATQRTSRAWWTDSFVRDEVMEWNQPLLDHEFNFSRDEPPLQISMDGSSGQDTIMFKPFDEHVASYAGSLETVIPLRDSPVYLHPWNIIFNNQAATDTATPFTCKWVQNTLLTLLKEEANDDLAEYYLGLHWANDSSSIKKAAKSLLKARPSSLRLYNAYALLEWLKDHKDVSSSVFDAAFSMRNSLPEDERANIVLLCRTRAWCFLNSRDRLACLKAILQIGETSAKLSDMSDTISPASILKARNDLTSYRDYFLSAGDLGKALNCTDCLALLEYLTSSSIESTTRNQGHIDSALAVFDKFSANLTERYQNDRSIHHELLYQAVTRLLNYHIKSGSFRPALIRDRLTKYVTFFPHNTIFLSLYAWNERRLRIDDRVRTILRDVALTESADSIVTRLFAIRHETRAGNVHSVHAAFENAVSSANTSSNPGLWKLYLIFCTSNKEYQGRAKDIFYRGMRACPWSKGFMMLAFTELREALSFEELRSIFRAMNEKELRVHVDLEERLEDDR